MIPRLYRRFFRGPDTHHFLFGPRGTGKSTWTHLRYRDALWLDLLDAQTLQLYRSDPSRLRKTVENLSHPTTIVIDEIQRIPQLLSVVHLLIEQKRGHQFILTGSSARKLKRKGVDLLAGRALVEHLHPFMAAELDERFNLDRALTLGMLPVVIDSGDPQKTLKAYTFTYLQEEVQAEGLVRDLGAFSRFLEAMSFSHGSVLNISNVARECAVGRKTAAGYLEILHDLLLSFEIPVFTKRAKRNTARRPKFYLFDTGLYHSLRPKGPLDRADELNGAGLEGLVAQHLRAWMDYSGGTEKLFYWRTRHGVEVDFIVYGPNHFVAIEVKNTRTIHPGQLRSLKSFYEDYPECTPVLLYRGEETQVIDGILCIPVDRWLRALKPHSDLLARQAS